MDDIAQLKKQIDDTVAALSRRLADAHQRKARADKEAASSANEITVITKALQDFKPLQGYFGMASAMAVVAAGAAKIRGGGSNRQIVIPTNRTLRETTNRLHTNVAARTRLFSCRSRSVSLY